jgi:DNA-binding NtrC family response regulator
MMSRMSEYTNTDERRLKPPRGPGSAVVNGNARVLIVEDNEIQRTTLADLLRLWGYDTETASDGLEALEKMPVFRPKVVISDLTMPRMGGMELLQTLRSKVPGVDCIIVTACGTRSDSEVVTALGAIDYLEKPLDLERLRRDLWRLAPCEECTPAGFVLYARAEAV